MENSNSRFLKSIMTSGAITGGIMIVYTFILNLLKLNENASMSFISYIILIGGIVYGTKQIRDRIQSGFITYGKGVGSGVLVSFFSSILVAFFVYLQLRYFNPELLNKTIETMQQGWMNSGLSDQEVETLSSIYEKFVTPGFTAFSTILGFTFLGTIFSLITSAFLKKQPDIFSDEYQNNSNF